MITDNPLTFYLVLNKLLISNDILDNSDTVKVSGIVTIEIAIFVLGKRIKSILENVLHVPVLGYQLLSVPMLEKSGLMTSFHSKRNWITMLEICFRTSLFP